MNLRRLKYFVKIVDIGSLTQAAEVLHIAQPALSQQVATLEGEMDQQLLIRTKRGVTPTEAGKILYTHARTILRQCEQAQLAVNNVGQTLRGQVSIGLAPGTAASAITMPLLQTVRNELPEVMVYLQESSGTALNDKLLAGQLDMAVLYERSPVAGIVSQPLLKEDLYLVGTRDCPGQSVDLTAVAEMNLFLPRDYSAVRARVTEAFTLRRLSAKIIGEIESITTLTAAIASGMGATVFTGIRCSFPMRGGERLDGADQHAFNEPVAVAEHVGSRQSVAAGAGGERDPAVSGEPPIAGKP
ncbi:Nitrogen assimilation regulatory protein Nac [Klebsiella aerogenes]|nr:Nitrogen assimilation regulatory protein Nac [Klebsiella aerogenes]